VDITWTAFPLHPKTPEEGLTLEDLFAGQNMDIPQMIAHLQKTADGLGLPFAGDIPTIAGKRRNSANERKTSNGATSFTMPHFRPTLRTAKTSRI